MANNIVHIKFNGLVSEDSILNITSSTSIPIVETFVLTRVAKNMVPITNDAARQAIFFMKSFGVDYNSTNLFTLEYNGIDTVTIVPIIPNTSLVVVANSTGATVTIIDVPGIPENNFAILSAIVLEASSNKCDNVKVRVTANALIELINSPVQAININNEVYDFDYIRDSLITIEIGASEITKTTTLQLPPKLAVDNISINITYSLVGATVAATVSNAAGLILQYSLSGNVWQDSSIFIGQLDGEATMYIKDQYGCVVTKPYTVLIFGIDEFNISVPYSYIPKTNAIKLVEQVVVDNINIYKNDENQFAHNILMPLNSVLATGTQLFQTEDRTPIYFKSNYRNITVKIIEDNGAEHILANNQITSNIGRKVKMDATYYKYDATRLGIYFTSGNTYNYDTGLANGTYALNGNLPEFAIIGEYINVSGIILQIKQVVYDDSIGYNVILLDFVTNTTPTNVVVSSIYNIHNYEVYEVGVAFAQYANTIIEIQVEMLDTREAFLPITYISENLDVRDVHYDTLELIYYNEINIDNSYMLGTPNKLRLEYDKISPILVEEFENSINDSDSVSVYSVIHEINRFVFSEVDNEMAKKIVIALSHKNVFINRIGYIKHSTASINAITDNSSTITVDMLKTGISYSSELVDALIIDARDIPALLEINNNFIKY